jgi:uncharacterized protein YutE (UPF0331/DUF86 family)
MRRVTAISDDDTKLTIQLGDREVVEDVIDLNLLWTECREDDVLAHYNRFRNALVSRWGVEVSKATSYLVVEEHAKIIAELKKTHSGSVSLPLMESAPQEKAPPS